MAMVPCPAADAFAAWRSTAETVERKFAREFGAGAFRREATVCWQIFRRICWRFCRTPGCHCHPPVTPVTRSDGCSPDESPARLAPCRALTSSECCRPCLSVAARCLLLHEAITVGFRAIARRRGTSFARCPHQGTTRYAVRTVARRSLPGSHATSLNRARRPAVFHNGHTHVTGIGRRPWRCAGQRLEPCAVPRTGHARSRPPIVEPARRPLLTAFRYGPAISLGPRPQLSPA